MVEDIFNLGPLKRTKMKDFKEILIQNLTMIKETFQFRSIETKGFGQKLACLMTHKMHGAPLMGAF